MCSRCRDYLNTPPHREHSSSHGVLVYLMPRNPWNRENFFGSRAFVKMSAMLSCVLMYESASSLDWTRSRIKWYFMLMCLTRSCRSGSSERLIAALLSQRIVVGVVDE